MQDSYVIVSRSFVSGEGWRTVETPVPEGLSYEAAGRRASIVARQLDAEHGGSHFWTVDLHSVSHPEHGSYYQLFHGRLS